jgi:carboxyl-terminal processing protease
MTRPDRIRFAWAALCWAAGLAGATAQTPPPAPVPIQKPGVGFFLDRAAGFERDRRWQQAADLYERCFKLHGDRDGVRAKWKLAERRHNLARRLYDPSNVADLLTLDEEKMIGLLTEVYRKIQTYYVEPIDFDALARAGYRQLDFALGEPCFIESETKAETRAKLPELRKALSGRPLRAARSLADLLEDARAAAQLCEPCLNHRAAAMVEFLSASCEALDPYSAHLSPNRLRDLYATIDGNFVGLGVEVRPDRDGLRVASVLGGSPAESGGVRDGDTIVAIDGKPLANLSTEEAANLLQGPAGSAVSMTLKDAKGADRRLTLIRSEVVVHSVTGECVVDARKRIGYVKLASFQKTTAAELREAIDRLVDREGVESIVLDLRGNPGGLLDVSVQVANRFIPDGVVVRTRGRAWGQSWDHEAKSLAPWTMKLAVLVDGDSASAAEILAGAIKDHRRGVLIGTRTYGKGSVQSIFPLQSAGTGLRLTTAKFYSPLDKPYDGIGVEPDVLAPRPLVGPLGEETPPPRRPNPSEDEQLAIAIRSLGDLGPAVVGKTP